MEWRNPFRRRPSTPDRALTAAAVSATTRYDGDSARRQDRRVSEAWDIYRLVGEVHYAVSQQARLVGRLSWRLSVNGNEMDSEPAEEVMTAAFGSPAVLRDLQVTAAIHMQVAGGYHLTKTGDKWEILKNPAEGPTKKKLEAADLVVTVENPDPAEPRMRLDSPVLAVLDIARELLLARGQARAMARNRTAQLGVLLYPIEGAGADRTAFEQEFIDVITAPLADEMSTASVVPNLVGFPAEYIEGWKTLDLGGDVDDKIHERIEKLVHQLAVVLDSPIEVLEGTGDTNHWGAWLVSEDNYLNHVEPLASPIGEGFAQALELLLSESGEDDVEIEPDPQNLLKRRPTIENSLKAAEMGIVREEWVLEQLGASPEDAGPGIQAAWQAQRSRRGITSGDDAPASQEPAATAAIPAPVEPLAITAAAAEPDTRVLAQLDVDLGESMSEMVSDTADRALERLGAQLRSMAQGGKVDLPDIPNQQVAIAYTQDIPNQSATIEDTATRFEPQFDRFTSRAFRKLRDAGVDLEPAKGDQIDAFAAFRAEVGNVVAARRAGRTGESETWRASLRVNAILGGNGDPVASPVVSAAGFPISPPGIALGRRSVSAMSRQYGVVPGKGSGTTPTGALTRTLST